MAAAKRTTLSKPALKKCPDCKGAGQVAETFQVGSRRRHESSDRQESLCLACWGSGEATDPS